MSVIAGALRELTGLFIDDGALALAIVTVIAVATAIALLMPDGRLIAGAVLVLGCFAALAANVLKAARR